MLWNSALVTAIGLRSFAQCRADATFWGRLAENAVGAHLLNHLQGLAYEVTYWRERNNEVDYVVRSGRTIYALEIKSGRPGRPAGLDAFCRRHPRAHPLIVGTDGVPLDEFFATSPHDLLPSLL